MIELIFWLVWFSIGAALAAVIDYRARRQVVPYGKWPSGVPVSVIRLSLWIICLALGPFLATHAAFQLFEKGKQGDTQ